MDDVNPTMTLNVSDLRALRYPKAKRYIYKAQLQFRTFSSFFFCVGAFEELVNMILKC